MSKHSRGRVSINEKTENKNRHRGIIPGVQKPHWDPWPLARRSWIGCRPCHTGSVLPHPYISFENCKKEATRGTAGWHEKKRIPTNLPDAPDSRGGCDGRTITLVQWENARIDGPIPVTRSNDTHADIPTLIKQQALELAHKHTHIYHTCTQRCPRWWECMPHKKGGYNRHYKLPILVPVGKHDGAGTTSAFSTPQLCVCKPVLAQEGQQCGARLRIGDLCHTGHTQSIDTHSLSFFCMICLPTHKWCASVSGSCSHAC